jgi:hypothetical protein
VLATLGAFVLYLLTLAPTVTWRNGGSDGAELATAAYVWGVPHPPGYPLYLILVRLVQFLPAGDLAHRAGLFSAAAGALSVGLVYATVVRLLGSDGWRPQVAALFAALLFATAPLAWSQSVIAEVYSFGEALLGGFLLCLATWVRQPSLRSAVATTTALSLLAAHQPPLGAAFIPLAVLAARERMSLRDWLSASLPLLLIPLLFGTLWLRAIFDPPLNLGSVSTLDRLISHVTAQDYRGYFVARPFVDELPRVPAAAALLVRQTHLVGAFLAVLGGVWLWTERRSFALVGLPIAALLAIFTVLYNAENGEVYLLPTVQLFSVAAGVGAAWVLWAFDGIPLAAICAGLAALLLWRVPSTWPEVDVSHDVEARQWGESTLASAPAQAVLRTNRDEDTFVLWYLHIAEGVRPDVYVVDDRLLALAWYRGQLARLDPRLLELPNAISTG